MNKMYPGFCLLLCYFVLQTAYSQPLDKWGEIELIRDEWGIAHIFSDTDPGALYGLGYATVEDRAIQMTFALRTVQGRTAEVLGDVQSRRANTIEFDKKMRTIGWYHGAKQVTANLDQDTLDLLQAYCDGINDSFKNRFNNDDDSLAQVFDELNLTHEEWNPADCVAVWWNFARFFAPEGLHDTMVYLQHIEAEQQPQQQAQRGEQRDAQRGEQRGNQRGDARTQALIERARNMEPVADHDASVIKRDDVSDEWIQKLNEYVNEHGLVDSESGEEGPKFSHAWVVGGKKTTTGSAVLCSDPQTPVRNPSLLYEFHLSGKTFNARGIGVAGSPIILIGFNETVAWGATALGADQADQFLLETDAEHPNQYFFEGEWRDMQVWQETIKVNGGEDQTFTMRWTHFGPVGSDIAHAVRPGMEVALKRVPISIKDQETIQGGLAMMRSKDVHEIGKALSKWSFPSANFIVGDKAGNIGYWANGAIPVRSEHAIDAGKMSHQGTEAKYDWQEILPHELLPQVVNPEQGFLFSGNHRPIDSFYPIPIGISTGSLGDSDRSRRLRERLQAQDSFTPEDVLDIHYDNVNVAKRDIVRLGYYLLDEKEIDMPEAAQNTLAHLRDWYDNGAHQDLNQAGAELALHIPTFFRIVSTTLAINYGGGNSGLNLFLKTVLQRLAEDPEADLTEDEQAFIVESLEQAWQTASNNYGRNPDQWNQIAKEQVLKRTLAYQDTLDGFGSLDAEKDVQFPALRTIDGGTIFSQAAQSYSQWVPLHDVDQAKAILPIGLSENPGDESYLSQFEHWKSGDLRPAPLSRNAVEKILQIKSSLSN